MRGLVGVALLVVGCGMETPGALIVVHSDVPTKRYELAYSLARCADCAPQMAPPSRPLLPIGNAVGWLTEDMNRFPIELEEPRDIARFQLQTLLPDDLLVERAIIVALEGDTPVEHETVLGVATIGSFTVPANDSVKFEVDLAPADSAFDTPTGNEHVEFWRPDLTRPACVVVQHATGAEYFGPVDDPDCDDGARGNTYECTEYGYLSYGPPMVEAAKCVALDSDLHCRIGGPPCLEQPMTTPPPGIPQCMAVEPSYCLPQHICALGCPNRFDPNCPTFAQVGAPLVTCDVYTSSGATCQLNRSRMSLQELVADTATRGCKSIEVANISSPLTFGSRVVFGDGVFGTFLIDPATFDAATCSIDTTWSGELNYTAVALIKIVTDTGVNRVVPWRLFIKGTTCPASIPTYTCTAQHGLGTDTLYSCQ